MDIHVHATASVEPAPNQSLEAALVTRERPSHGRTAPRRATPANTTMTASATRPARSWIPSGGEPLGSSCSITSCVTEYPSASLPMRVSVWRCVSEPVTSGESP